jgi:hypothetical protein
MHKKVISKISLTNMSKSINSAYFRHVFANNFFWCIFSKNFHRIHNQRDILSFFIPILNCQKKKKLHFLALLVNFDCKCTRNG